MTKKQLMTIDRYCLVTFPTTNAAIQAEKLLQDAAIPCLLVPVPREISQGCGLAARFFREDYKKIAALFGDKQIKTGEYFRVEKTAGVSKIHPYVNTEEQS